MSEETIYLVDGTSICYRSFFAIRLSTSKGFPSGAVYGFYQTLKKLITRYKPVYMGICFDVSRKTFRHEKFTEYKIQRPPLPDSLKSQIPVIKRLIGLLGIALIEKEGFEADDVIATITKKALKENKKVIIVSSDKDMYQLLDSDKVKIYDDVGDELISKDNFKNEFGFAPNLIIDYLALTGDSVDNVPGAKGIGKVGASKLVAEFGTIENMFNNIEKIPQKTQGILIREKESIVLSKDLVTLSDYDLALSWQDFMMKDKDDPELHKLFQELEFKSLLKDFASPMLNIKVDIKDELPKDFLKKSGDKEIILYTEGQTAYLSGEGQDIVYKTTLAQIKDALGASELKKISYDFKAQFCALSVPIKGAWFDVKIAAYLLDSSFSDYELPTLVSHYLGEYISEIPCEAKTYFISRLYKLFYPKLKECGMEDLFFNVEMPLMYVLYGMHEWGVKMDIKALIALSKEVEKKLEGLKKEIFNFSGKEFNLNSPKQLGVVLFADLKIPPVKKTKTGYSTNEDVLVKLSLKYPIAKLILEYRELNKLGNTYVTPLIEMVKEKNSRLHAEFNQTQTQTGRLSSSSPNLQSIPIKGAFSTQLRSSFVSSFTKGFILCADYSQIELRILAHFSGDETLKEAFAKKIDVHRYTAALLFGIKKENVDDHQRTLAKKINFAIIYGMSAYGLSKELNIGVQEAEIFISDYFRRYPKVQAYIQGIYKNVDEHGYVTTILGRRRYLPDFKSPNMQLKDFAQRQAVNTPIQGSCADLIKLAMVRINEELEKNKFKSKLIMQIHDELVFDVPEDELSEVSKIVKRNMEESIKLDVPLEVNLEAGSNWGNTEKV
ncbi:MAG: DNA polymerase I [Candidatus Omnitrophota bacterium]|jgi:DNA polymerase-1